VLYGNALKIVRNIINIYIYIYLYRYNKILKEKKKKKKYIYIYIYINNEFYIYIYIYIIIIVENVKEFNKLNTIRKLVELLENQPEDVLINVAGALGACAQTGIYIL